MWWNFKIGYLCRDELQISQPSKFKWKFLVVFNTKISQGSRRTAPFFFSSLFYRLSLSEDKSNPTCFQDLPRLGAGGAKDFAKKKCESNANILLKKNARHFSQKPKSPANVLPLKLVWLGSASYILSSTVIFCTSDSLFWSLWVKFGPTLWRVDLNLPCSHLFQKFCLLSFGYGRHNHDDTHTKSGQIVFTEPPNQTPHDPCRRPFER